MATIALGDSIDDMSVTLPADADFVANLINQTGDWPDGIGAELHLIPADGSTIVWTATVTGPTIAFYEAKTAVIAAIGQAPKSARLHYLDESGHDLLWRKGRIYVA